jgi:hypothetical protein
MPLLQKRTTSAFVRIGLLSILLIGLLNSSQTYAKCVSGNCANACTGGGPCFVFLPGAGGVNPTEIEGDIQKFRQVIGTKGELVAFGASGPTYTAEDVAEANNFIAQRNFNSNNLHVIAFSNGAVAFETGMVPHLPQNAIGAVYLADPVAAGQFARSAVRSDLAPGFWVNMHQNLRGGLLGTGPTRFEQPNSIPVFDITLAFGNDIVEAFFQTHPQVIGEAREVILGVIPIQLKFGLDAAKSELVWYQKLLDKERPETPGNIHTITSPREGSLGSGNPSGGGVGIESFPLWTRLPKER